MVALSAGQIRVMSRPYSGVARKASPASSGDSDPRAATFAAIASTATMRKRARAGPQPVAAARARARSSSSSSRVSRTVLPATVLTSSSGSGPSDCQTARSATARIRSSPSRPVASASTSVTFARAPPTASNGRCSTARSPSAGRTCST